MAQMHANDGAVASLACTDVFGSSSRKWRKSRNSSEDVEQHGTTKHKNKKMLR